MSKVVNYVEVEQENGIYAFETGQHPSMDAHGFLSYLHNLEDDEALLEKMSEISKQEAQAIYDQAIQVIGVCPFSQETEGEVFDFRSDRFDAIREVFAELIEE